MPLELYYMKKFINDHIAELHNVSWPTQKQAVHAMATVLTIMAITGAILGVLDSFLGQLFASLI